MNSALDQAIRAAQAAGTALADATSAQGNAKELFDAAMDALAAAATAAKAA